jgi:hypothetical protein
VANIASSVSVCDAIGTEVEIGVKLAMAVGISVMFGDAGWSAVTAVGEVAMTVTVNLRK